MENNQTVTLKLPVALYDELQMLAAEEELEPVEVIAHWVELAQQRQAWLQGWQQLKTLVKQEDGFQPDLATEEIVEQLRQTRQEIFEAEYAHLYR